MKHLLPAVLLLVVSCGGGADFETSVVDLDCPPAVPWEVDLSLDRPVISAEVLPCRGNKTCSPSPLPSGTTITADGWLSITTSWCPPGDGVRLLLLLDAR